MVDIKENGQYKNLVIKTKYKWDASKRMHVYDENNKKIVVDQGLKPDESLEVVKKFAEGREVVTKYGTSYSCGVEYQGEEMSFWLDEKQHEKYKNLGGEGDKVRITCKLETYFDKRVGVDKTIEVLFFEKVE